MATVMSQTTEQVEILTVGQSVEATALLLVRRLDASLPPVVRASLADTLGAFIGGATIADRIDGFIGIVGWLRAGGDPEVDLFARGPDRIALLIQVVEGDVELRAAFQRALSSVFADATGENLFGETGVPHRRGFVGEFVERLLTYVLPSPRDDHDLSRLVRRVFPGEREAQGFFQLSSGHFARLTNLLFPAD